MEEWKQYKDTIYEISSLGRVRNKKTGLIKKQHKKYNGSRENDYMKVSINVNRTKRTVSVHRLVAECFLENYNEQLEVNHKNSIRYDNRVENLEMSTKEQNYIHSLEYGGGSHRRPVCAIDNNGDETYFPSLWNAGRYIKTTQEKITTIDHVCNNIKQSINGGCKRAYGYEWREA